MTKRLKSWAATLWVHLLGVILCTLLIPLPWVNEQSLSLFFESLAHQEFRAFTLQDLLIQFGLSICAWALLYIGYQLIRLGWKNRKSGRVFKVAKGTAMVETLIVMPAFLLLSLAIMQLAINNIAVVLTNLATFQAARTVFVWAGEMQGQRKGVGYFTLMNKARIQAAQALTPVAPGDYFRNPLILNADFYKARAGMLGQQLPLAASDQGAIAMPLTFAVELEDLEGLTASAEKENLSLTRSLDATSFRTRSVRKFTWAYNATTVVPFAAIGRSGAVVIYSHNIAMPMMTHILGEKATVAGRQGYYMTISRQFNYGSQVPASPLYPRP